MAATIQELPMTVTVLDLLAIWPGRQDRVLVAYVDRSMYQRHYTTAVVVRYALQSIHFHVAQDRFEDDFIFVLCPRAADVSWMNNTTWTWMEERLLFRAVERLTLVANQVPP